VSLKEKLIRGKNMPAHDPRFRILVDRVDEKEGIAVWKELLYLGAFRGDDGGVRKIRALGEGRLFVVRGSLIS
jgi:hypothetical protein